MIKYLRLALRGTRRLPHVGSHPGNGLLLAMIAIGAAVGGQRAGFAGALAGAAFNGICIGTVYLLGAYDRARYVDTLQAKERGPQRPSGTGRIIS